MSVPHLYKKPKSIFAYRTAVVWSVENSIENRKSIALLVQKIYQYDLYAIYNSQGSKSRRARSKYKQICNVLGFEICLVW